MSLLRSEVYSQVFVLSLLIAIIVRKKSQYLWNKHITAWKMLCTIFIHSLFRIRKLTGSLNSLVRFLILLNSWIKIVRAHFPWSNFYRKHVGIGGLLLWNESYVLHTISILSSWGKLVYKLETSNGFQTNCEFLFAWLLRRRWCKSNIFSRSCSLGILMHTKAK